MYGSSLIFLPDRCDLPPVKRQRKKNAAPVSVPTPTPTPAQPPQPASSKGFKQRAEHVPHKRGAVGACALSPVSDGHCQGRNPTRDLRLCEARALHPALALHRPRVH